ncbi:DUF397 domain-containing protein [Actinacidiphila sp. ITFR-21]|uniref:DUF397 domain-containing protein n=1 Tax=Actinacidiphila sp. ITFR-21 TaxID=3075199 RepID=UPI00288A11B9|nr:DUF397 domain-containing protein [Streptomyces sp. ITFR-21]WNI16024.1 DUF397 domain-containing protein [Streptomyces sp. ITFR-21]
MHLKDGQTAVTWRKSSYSDGSGGDCIEASDSLTSATWRKSTYSGGDGGNCVEFADNLPDVIPVRDSKDPHGPALTFTPAAWTAFVQATARGVFPTA